MRYWITALLLGTSAQATTLTVEVSDIQTNVGSVNFAVYDNKESWLKSERAIAKQSVRVSDSINQGTITVEFELEPGDYAVAVHHDDNDNGEMDTNFVGIPKEPTGVSNGEIPRFGPPRYKNAVFTLGEDGVRMPIKLLE